MDDTRQSWGCMAGAALILALMWMMVALSQRFMQPRASLIDLDDHAATEITARVQAEEETERLRIAEENETTRERIDARTTGTIVGVVGGGLVAVLVVGLAAWARVRSAQAQAIPPHVMAQAIALLQEDAQRRVAMVDGEWVVVDDARRTLYPLLTTADN